VRLVADSGGLQVLQLGVLDGETRDGVERVQQYGFTSVPLSGAEAVVLFVGGRRDHGLVVAVDDRRYRLRDLAPGEVALYASAGQRMHLKADGSIDVGGGTMQPAALATALRTELDAIWTALGSHTHPVPGVTTGTGSTTSSAPVVVEAKETIASASVNVRT
jgi:phage baseplate assembly protein V